MRRWCLDTSGVHVPSPLVKGLKNVVPNDIVRDINPSKERHPSFNYFSYYEIDIFDWHVWFGVGPRTD